MSWVAAGFAMLLAVTAAGAAALIVLPAPSMTLALVAIAASEKSVFIACGAVVGAVLALLSLGPGRRALNTVALLLCIAAVVVSLVPFAQALRVASEHRVELDLWRYLRSPIDTRGPIRARRTVTYATVDGVALGMDIYAPAKRPIQPSRAILVLHGGGWSAGEKGEASLASQRLADGGFTVFDVEYRTKPQPNWKTATGDVKCALAWVKRHAGTDAWNIDPGKITLLGRSAGAHLALLVAYTPADPRLPSSCPTPRAPAPAPAEVSRQEAPLGGATAPTGAHDDTVESVVAFYPATDLVWGYEHPSPPRVYDSSAKLRGFIGGPPETTGDLYRLLSPTARASASSPRTLLIHGGRDQLIGRQHLDMLAEKLHAVAVPYETLIIPYAQHGFDFVFGGLSGQISETVLVRFLNAR